MANLTDTGNPRITSGSGLQPKMKDRFRVRFANIGGGGVDSQPLSFQLVSTDRPKISHTEVEVNRYNSRAWVASKHEFQPINITIEDDVTGAATSVIRDQMQRQQWLIGAEGPFLAKASEGSLYKFMVFLEGMDGGERVIERWILEGCWIREVDYGDMTYNDGEKIEIKLVVRFDNARQEIGGYVGPGTVN